MLVVLTVKRIAPSRIMSGMVKANFSYYESANLTVEYARNLKRAVIAGMNLTVTFMVLEAVIRTAC